LKGEVKSCNIAAAILINDLDDLYTKKEHCLALIKEKYKMY
jgi:hypothetical protein